MIQKMLDIVNSRFPLEEKNVGDMARLKVSGMKFSVGAFYAKGLGHIGVMRAKGFFGLMKMDTLVINPTDIDLPLYSYDRINAAGNDTLIVEMYDTLLGELDTVKLEKIKERFSHLPKRDPGEHWYDKIKLPASISLKGKKSCKAEFDSLVTQQLTAFLDLECLDAPEKEEKLKKASVYVEGLLENGGPSTDVFKKSLGEDKTKLFFRRYLFGTNTED